MTALAVALHSFQFETPDTHSDQLILSASIHRLHISVSEWENKCLDNNVKKLSITNSDLTL